MYEVYLMSEEKSARELDLDGVFDFLKTGKPENNTAVVRCSTDRDFFRVIARIEELKLKGANGAQLSGGVVKIWLNTSSFPDGPGWRVILSTAVLQANMPAVPGLNGGRPHPGRG